MDPRKGRGKGRGGRGDPCEGKGGRGDPCEEAETEDPRMQPFPFAAYAKGKGNAKGKEIIDAQISWGGGVVDWEGREIDIDDWHGSTRPGEAKGTKGDYVSRNQFWNSMMQEVNAMSYEELRVRMGPHHYRSYDGKGKRESLWLVEETFPETTLQLCPTKSELQRLAFRTLAYGRNSDSAADAVTVLGDNAEDIYCNPSTYNGKGGKGRKGGKGTLPWQLCSAKGKEGKGGVWVSENIKHWVSENMGLRETLKEEDFAVPHEDTLEGDLEDIRITSMSEDGINVTVQLLPDGLECDAPVLKDDTALCLKNRLRVLFDGIRPEDMGDLTIGGERLESDDKLYEWGVSDNAHLLLEVSEEHGQKIRKKAEIPLEHALRPRCGPNKFVTRNIRAGHIGEFGDHQGKADTNST